MDFRAIDKENLSDSELILLDDIEETYERVRILEAQMGLDHQLSKCYFVFAFNLFLLRAVPEGLEMLTHIDPTYYSEQLTADVEEGFKYLQEMEDLKNQVSPEKLERRKYCQQESEILDVAFGMMIALQYLDFPGKDHFQQFIDDMAGKTYTVRKVPKISLVQSE